MISKEVIIKLLTKSFRRWLGSPSLAARWFQLTKPNQSGTYRRNILIVFKYIKLTSYPNEILERPAVFFLLSTLSPPATRIHVLPAAYFLKFHKRYTDNYDYNRWTSQISIPRFPKRKRTYYLWYYFQRAAIDSRKARQYRMGSLIYSYTSRYSKLSYHALEYVYMHRAPSDSHGNKWLDSRLIDRKT